MKILLVYPEYPDTFWSFKNALNFIFKKASHPPLGLLTVAAMLPGEWEKKLVDMNVRGLNDEDLEWADFVFVSAMTVQKESVKELIARCKKTGVKIVAGGPLFTTGHEEFKDVDLRLGYVGSYRPNFIKNTRSHHIKSSTYEVSLGAHLQNV